VSFDGSADLFKSRSAVSQALLALLQQLCFASVSNTKSAKACAAGNNFKEATKRLSMIKEAIHFIIQRYSLSMSYRNVFRRMIVYETMAISNSGGFLKDCSYEFW
jgi:hypothetical protein